MDQAATLREHQPAPAGGSKDHRIHAIAVASGKGGVGKSFVATNLAVAFKRLQKRVLIVDADLGLANDDIMLGVNPKYTLQDAIFQGLELAEVVTPCMDGIDLLAASAGSKEMVSLGDARMNMIIEELLRFAQNYDVLLFDCASGINSSVLAFIAAAPQNLIVATSQPTSIMDVYALIKVVHQRQLAERISLVVNMASSKDEGVTVYKTLTQVTQRFLPIPLHLLGIIPSSTNVNKAVTQRRPLMVTHPNHPVSGNIMNIASGLLRERSTQLPTETLNLEALAEGFKTIGKGGGAT